MKYELFPYIDYWMPHSHCVYANRYIIGFDSFGGILTGIAYMLIPLLLARVVIAVWKYLTRASKALIMHGAAFVFLCGTTHFIDVWNWWHNDYHVAAIARTVTGFVSIAFAWRTFLFIRQRAWTNEPDA